MANNEEIVNNEQVVEVAETVAEVKAEAPVEAKAQKVKGQRTYEKKERGPKKPETRREDSEFDKKLVEVRRVAKTVKGGRTMRFSALVVVGAGQGRRRL